MEKKGVHYYNIAKIAFTRAAWVLSIPNTLSMMFLVWTNGYFQGNYSGIFLNNFWVFIICLLVPFFAYMTFEYRKVWAAEIEISNQKSWDAGYNPLREMMVDTNREVHELRKLVEELRGARNGPAPVTGPPETVQSAAPSNPEIRTGGA